MRRQGHRAAPHVVAEPQRPSHFEEDQNVRVPRNHTDNDYPTEADTTTHFGFHAPPPDPIPVYITETTPERRVVKDWRPLTVTLTAAAQPNQLGSASLKRTRMVVRNNDVANSLIVVKSPTDNVNTSGFTILAGKEIEFFHNRAVWGYSLLGASVTVLEEFDIEDAD